MAGQVVHFELPAEDLDRAQKFYQEAFGWRMNAQAGQGYVLVTTTETDERGHPRTAGSINGGMLRRQDPVRHPIITILVDDVDGAIKKVVKAGGKIVRGREAVGSIGIAAYVQDPEGNTVGLWQPLMG
jgi:uncharacterized protein